MEGHPKVFEAGPPILPPHLSRQRRARDGLGSVLGRCNATVSEPVNRMLRLNLLLRKLGKGLGFIFAFKLEHGGCSSAALCFHAKLQLDRPARWPRSSRAVADLETGTPPGKLRQGPMAPAELKQGHGLMGNSVGRPWGS